MTKLSMLDILDKLPDDAILCLTEFIIDEKRKVFKELEGSFRVGVPPMIFIKNYNKIKNNHLSIYDTKSY